MAQESKVDESNVFAPREFVARSRFVAPIESAKIRIGPVPAGFGELLESVTAVAAPGTSITAPIVASAAPAPAAAPVRPRAPTATAKATIRPPSAAAPSYRLAERHATPAALPTDLVVPLTEEHAVVATKIKEEETSRVEIHPVNSVTDQVGVFVPPNRKGFKQFIIAAYRKYKLDDVPLIPDPDACAKALEASKKEVKTFKYQSFVRDYMQRPSPYRGVLVYHGLGSGKTCTSIAALEALYQEHQRPIYILTPASLQPNYRDEITKCGPYVFRIKNHWTWVPVDMRSGKPSSEGELLVKVIGVPPSSLRKRKGGWLPNPNKESNFESLTAAERRQIQEQIVEMMDARFVFINYNGISEKVLRGWACGETKKFDGCTVVIDEVHNLIRTINNSPLESLYKDEPRSKAEYDPAYCKVAKQAYTRSYLLYRMLCDAVGVKIIALSATPIINFPQEVAILANMLGGDERMVEITAPVMNDARKAAINRVFAYHPEIDFYEIVTRGGAGGSTTSTVRFTPVPSGFRKVVNPATGEMRGFIRDARDVSPEEVMRERNLAAWFDRVNAGMRAAGLPPFSDPRFMSTQRLPDLEEPFREEFIDTETLEVKKNRKGLLAGRLSGLISFYKGGKADLMATSKDHTVYVDMSNTQLKEYTDVRNEEITRERREKKKPAAAKGVASGSLYDQVNKTQSSTFKIFSRAACNFSFPTEMERPRPSDYRDALKMIGARPGASGDAVADELDRSTLDPEGILLETAAVPAETEEEAVGPADEAAGGAGATKVTTYEMALTNALAEMRRNAAELFRRGKLEEMSPKFQAIIDRLTTSPGPVLVYSNFKTLEGVGLFGLALEAQLGFKKLDIVLVGGKYRLAEETRKGTRDTPYYISYTGDEDRDKRNILLAIFNGKWEKVPGELAAEVRDLTGAADNKSGKICKVFMITQSGAEGISLSNVRQVHMMEPYWNYVRLDQVKGRAIRICSHMDLPVEQRHVDTFIYISRFSAEQKTTGLVDKTLFNLDEGQTTDEQIWTLMNAKKKLADSMLEVMRISAVDCELNTTENGGYACYYFKHGGMDKIYHPLLSVDVVESAASIRTLE